MSDAGITDHRRNSGFSLVELIMVLGILSIVAALAVPRYAVALGEYRAEHAARRIAADIAATQAVARATSSARDIFFDPTTNSYRLDAVVAGNAPVAVTLADAPFDATLVSATFNTAANATTTMRFNGYGVPASGGSVVVRSGKTTRRISVDSVTGQAVIE